MASAKLDVDISGLQANINTAKGIMKGLNAEMKATEAEFKNTGNAEQYLANKTKTLNSQLNMQKAVADSAEKALKQMTDSGVDPADASYQRMYATLMNAQAGMNETQAALNELGTSAQQAATGADQLTNSVQGISKKISLDQVISGIDKITGGLENAAKKAVKLGEDLWNSIMEQAQWADDTATMAQMYGIDLDTFQRMQKLVTNGMDTTVEAVLNSQSKLKKGIGNNTKATMEALNDLGISLQEWQTVAGQSGSSLVSRDMIDVFWEAGQAIMGMSDAAEQEAKAQALFGRSWHELVPLFSSFKTAEEYSDALSKVKVNSEEDVTALAALNDKVSELKGNFDTLSREVLAQLAPALTDAANALNGLLENVLDYLETPEGQQALQNLQDAVSGLFDDMGKIDPKSVVDSFTSVFTALTNGLQWVVDNKDTVITALGAIVAGWGALKITGGALEIYKLIQGITGLSGAGAATAAAQAGSAAGSSWGSAFASAVMKAAPWLVGLYTMLNPSAGSDATGDNTLIDENGNVTTEGMMAGLDQETATKEHQMAQQQAQMKQAMLEMTGLTEKQYQTLQGFWTYYDQIFRNPNPNDTVKDQYQKYSKELTEVFSGQEDVLSAYMKKMKEYKEGGGTGALGFDFFDLNGEGLAEKLAEIVGTVPVEGEVQVPEDTAAQISEAVGTVEINGVVHLTGVDGENIGVTSEIFGDRSNSPVIHKDRRQHANGLAYVPYDGYIATLHKGEQVVPAREAASRNYSSNLYIESMYMNNNTDAEGLAAAMASAQRRMMAGYGS